MAKKILVADDEVGIVDMVTGCLQTHGYVVIKACDGNEALSKAKLALPDLIILDIIMPGMNGSEVSQALKNNKSTSQIPIIFLTGLITADDQDSITGDPVPLDEGGAQNIVLSKPFSAEVLLNKIRQILG